MLFDFLEPFGLFALLYKIFPIYIIMLNLNKVGKPLCRVDKGKYNNMLVSVTDQQNDKDDDTIMKEFKRLSISNESKFQLVPDLTTERQIVYITGPSGSGKSTFTRKYIEELKKKKKDIPIYLIFSYRSR